MKSFAMFLGVAIAAFATVAASQETTTKSPSPTPAAETVKSVTASGEIVRYDAGKAIVLKQSDSRVVTYALSPTLTVPAEAQVGRRVTIYAETGPDGIVRVTRVTSLASDAAPATSQVPPQTTTYTRETGKVEQKAVTVTGDVVRYEAGKTIVVRSPDGREVTYAIAPSTPAPAEVTVGRRVSIVTEPSDSGPVLVTRITTETATADGQARTTTEKTELGPSGAATKTQITTVYGTVTAYDAGRSITILQPNRTTVTYTIDQSSTLPEGMATGKKVVVRTITRPGGKPIVRKVTYSTTTKKAAKIK
ncbi:MAG TPA: hypothetical protein VGK86_02040 [Thermoanaerobaculia bacterium]|jgi:hypothetical protein